MKKKEEREYLTFDKTSLKDMKKMLGIRKRNCHYCNEKITEENIGGIFNKPVRLVCKSILCLIEAMNEDDV